MGSWARKALSSLSINRFAYEGAILVPMAVPWICWYNYAFVEAKNVAFEYMLNRSSRTLGGMWEASANPMASRQASVPLS